MKWATLRRAIRNAKVPVIAGFARTSKDDIAKAWEAVQGAQKPRIHTFIATSEIHMKHKLKMDREQVIEHVSEMVAYARSLCADVEFSPEDAGRSDPEFLYVVLGEAIKSGTTTLNIPDTVGYTTPDEFLISSMALSSIRPECMKGSPSLFIATTISEWQQPILWLAFVRAQSKRK